MPPIRSVSTKPVIRVPSKATLRKYGLTVEEWWKIFRKQGKVCAICKKVPPSGLFVTDHEHIPKYKLLPVEQRRLYVRGITCNFCNLFLMRRQMTLERALAAVAYLQEYHKRRPVETHKPSRRLKKKRAKRR